MMRNVFKAVSLFSGAGRNSCKSSNCLFGHGDGAGLNGGGLC